MKLLFVCLGNICRSPAAEGIMNYLIQKEGLEKKIICDSAGTSAFHAGHSADSRMREHAKRRDYLLESKSRKFRTNDFKEFDYILTMDPQNYQDVCQLSNSEEELKKVIPITDFCVHNKVSKVPDPYYGGDRGFEEVLDILEDACLKLLIQIQTNPHHIKI